MNRKVHAILISVPKSTRYSSDTIPGADAAMARFRVMLEERFTDPPPNLWAFKRQDAKHDKVIQAFKDAAAAASGNDLFIVMFIGHGRKSDGDGHAYEAWALDDAELTDHEVASQIATLGEDVEVVIVSDSCYGGGFASGGQGVLRSVLAPMRRLIEKIRNTIYKIPFMRTYRAFKLKQHAGAWNPASLLRAAGRSTARSELNPIICISAAAWYDKVQILQMPKLIDETIAAIRSNGSHGSLADTFYMTAVPGAEFQLQARPNDRMCKPLLGTQHTNSNAQGAFMTAESAALTSPLISYAFINYDSKTCVVSLNLKQAVGLMELHPDDDPMSGATLSARDANGDCTLTLKPQVVAGFGSTTAVTIKLTNPSIDVIAWRGKDPTVPPPPPAPRLDRYKNTPDFEDQFKALLGTGDAEDDDETGAAMAARRTA